VDQSPHGGNAVVAWSDEDGKFAGEGGTPDDKLFFWGETIPEAHKAFEELVDFCLDDNNVCDEQKPSVCKP